jgi:hypothetical protein
MGRSTQAMTARSLEVWSRIMAATNGMTRSLVIGPPAKRRACSTLLHRIELAETTAPLLHIPATLKEPV